MKTIYLLLFICLGYNAQAQIVTHKLIMHSADTQCLNGNVFCFTDSIFPLSTRRLQKAVYLFSDGSRIDRSNFTSDTVGFCHSFLDPAGGTYSLTVELTDTTDAVLRQTYTDVMTVLPCNTAMTERDKQSQYKLAILPQQGQWLLSGPDLQSLKIELFDLNGRSLSMDAEVRDHGYLLRSNLPSGSLCLLLISDRQGRVLLKQLLLQ